MAISNNQELASSPDSMVHCLWWGDEEGVEGCLRRLGGAGGTSNLWSRPGTVLGSLHVISVAPPLSKIRKLKLESSNNVLKVQLGDLGFELGRPNPGLPQVSLWLPVKSFPWWREGPHSLIYGH